MVDKGQVRSPCHPVSRHHGCPEVRSVTGAGIAQGPRASFQLQVLNNRQSPLLVLTSLGTAHQVTLSPTLPRQNVVLVIKMPCHVHCLFHTASVAIVLPFTLHSMTHVYYMAAFLGLLRVLIPGSWLH